MAYMCRHVVLDDKNVNTCHLYHKGIFAETPDVIDRYKVNQKYYQEKRKILIEKIGDENINIFNEKYHLDLIKVNK
jgi:hypothetical protein